MIEEIIEELKSNFEGAQTRLARDLTRIRTGRANP